MFWKNIIDRIWYFNLILILILGSIFYLLLAKNSKSDVIYQITERSGLIARAESSNITSFFKTFGEAVATRARYINTHSETDLKQFMDQWRDTGLIGGIALTNDKGVVILNANLTKTRDVGVSLADRDYFVWGKTEAQMGDYYIGKPVVGRGTATGGKMIVPVASAVFNNGEFSGVIVSSVILESVAKNYLELMEVSSLTKISLKDEEGTILYEDSTKSNQNNYLVVKYPFNVGTQKWTINVSSPEEEIINQVRPRYIRQLSVFALIVFGIIMYGFLINRTKKIED